MRKIVTISARIYTPDKLRDFEIDEVLQMIESGICGQQDLRSITAQIQSETSHDVQNKLKNRYLPIALFNGTFSYKNSAGLKQYSNFTAMDFDGFGSEQDLQNIGYRLTNTPCVYSVFRTPSGKGLKAIVIHDNDNPMYHEELYEQLLQKFYIPTTDISVGDLARGNYICYDPNLWINTNCVPYNFIHNPAHMPKQKASSSCTGTPQDLVSLRKHLSFFIPFGKKSDESIINILNAKWIKDSSRWENGNRANSIFNSASELCRAGVNIDKSLEYLISSYKPTGMNEREIEYQTVRGYQNNLDKYGYNRRLFDSYGKHK